MYNKPQCEELNYLYHNMENSSAIDNISMLIWKDRTHSAAPKILQILKML